MAIIWQSYDNHNSLESCFCDNVQKSPQIVAFQISVRSDVLCPHELVDARITFPTSEFNLISAQMNVFIREDAVDKSQVKATSFFIKSIRK